MSVCEKVKERAIKDMGETGAPPTWPSGCRGDEQSKRDVLAEAEPFVLSLKKALFDWLNTGNQEVSSNIKQRYNFNSYYF